MSHWPSCKAREVLRALLRIGWVKPANSGGSHFNLERGVERFAWAFHDGVEIGPRMMARIAKQTGLKVSDL